MHELSSRDGDYEFDWGKTSQDYARYRPGPPPCFYDRLAALNAVTPADRVLDLGTGTGLLAREFARRGSQVAALDQSAMQIEMARQLAREDGVEVDFRTSPAESLPWSDPTFDVVTANQCWIYFDQDRVVQELRRVFMPGARLVTSHFSWLPRRDPLARATEKLVRHFNPAWSAFDWSGYVPPSPTWAEEEFEVRAMFVYDHPIEFTRESWMGRIRACRGIGAVLEPEAIVEFDREHERLLQRIAPPKFTILHRIDAHVFVLRDP